MPDQDTVICEVKHGPLLNNYSEDCLICTMLMLIENKTAIPKPQMEELCKGNCVTQVVGTYIGNGIIKKQGN